MGVFTATQVKDVAEQSHRNPEGSNVDNELRKTKPDSSTLQDPQPGEIPQNAVVGGSGEDAGKPIEIVVNGPLGHVYTQALNLLLSKEDMASGAGLGALDNDSDHGITVVGYDSLIDKEYAGDADSDKAYVYVTDGANVDVDELNNALNQIDAYLNDNPGASIMLGMENSLSASVEGKRLMRMIELKTKAIWCSRKSTMQALEGLVLTKTKKR